MPTPRERLEQLRARKRLQELRGKRDQARADQAPVIPQEVLDAREQPQFEEPGFGQQAAGVLENVGSFVSGAIAEPIAGIAGIAAGLNPFGDEGDSARAVEATKQALTTQPKTEAGVRQQRATGKALAPVAEAIKGTEEFLGGGTLEATRGTIFEDFGPALAAGMATLPTATLELLGFKGSRRFTKLGGEPTKKQVKQALVESAPEVKQLKDVAGKIYDEISDSGAKIKDTVTSNLGNNIKKKLVKEGFNKTNNPKINGLFRELDDVVANGADLSRMQVLRKTASNAAEEVNSIGKPTDTARLASIAVEKIDRFFDTVSPKNFEGAGQAAAGNAKKLKVARKIWGRARRAETIEDAITTGASRASGAEAGIRNELGKLVNSKNKRKFFSPDEISAMRKVVEGSFSQNFSKMLGKFGFSLDRSPNVFQGVVAGGGAGAAAGGISGAIGVPIIGTIARKISNNLTVGKSEFLATMTRAGNDGERIAKAYLSAVPKSKRKVQDLADLLSDPNVDISVLETIANRTIQDALDIAKGRRQINLAAAAGTGAAAPRVEEQANGQ